MTSKSYLFIFRSSPYGSSSTQEGLDALLAYATFEQPVTLLLMSEGVQLLQTKQQPNTQKNLFKTLKALELYDIEEVFILQSSLSAQEINTGNGLDALPFTVTQLTGTEATQLIQTSDNVLTF